MPEEASRSPRGILDTSVVIDHDIIDASLLPDDSAIAAVTIAELAAGPHSAENDAERARRQVRLQWAESSWEPLPFDTAAARAYGRIFAATRARRRPARSRTADLFIASIALSNSLPLYTRNPSDFEGLDELIDVVVV